MFVQMLWLGEDHLTMDTLIWLLSGVNLHMFHPVVPVLEPHLTRLPYIFPYVIVPVRVSFQFKWPRVQNPTVGFAAPVETDFEIFLQETAKLFVLVPRAFMCDNTLLRS
jgi:hypothetical protein